MKNLQQNIKLANAVLIYLLTGKYSIANNIL